MVLRCREEVGFAELRNARKLWFVQRNEDEERFLLLTDSLDTVVADRKTVVQSFQIAVSSPLEVPRGEHHALSDEASVGFFRRRALHYARRADTSTRSEG